MTGTPNLGLPLMATSDAQKEVLFNEAIIAFDVLAARVVGAIRTGPTASPEIGETYLVADSGTTGVFVGHENMIAFYYNGWQFLPPTAKMKLWVIAPGGYYTFSGASWIADAVSEVNALDDLGDVSITALADGDFLKYDGVALRWVNASIAAITSLNSLSDVEAATPSAGDVLAYNDTTHRWEPASLPVFVNTDRLEDLTDVDWTSIGANKILSWDATDSKAVWVDPVDPVPSTLSALTDVNVADAMANDALVFNGAVWGPSHLTYNYTFENMSDGPGTMEGHAGEFMVVNTVESALEFISLADLLSTSTFYLQDLGDIDEIPGDSVLGKTIQVYKDGGLYRFKYVALPTIPSYPVSEDGTQVVASMTSLNFSGFDVSNVGNAVTVTAIPLAWQAEDEDVEGDPVTTINFRGPGVGVTNVDGVLEVEIAGADAGAGGTYDLAMFFPGTLIEADQEVFRFPVVRPFRILSDFTGSQGNARVPPTADVDMSVKKNGTEVGTITFEAAGPVALHTLSGGVINFVAGDILEIIGPSAPDATLADFSLTIAGVKT